MTFADDLPFHPRTGLQAIGLLRNGKPIWPVLGGAEDDDDDAVNDDDAKAEEGQEEDSDGGDSGESDDDAKDDKSDDEDKPLGPAGEKAYLAEKEKRKQAAERARAEKARADAAEAELAKLRRAAERAKTKAAAKPEEKPSDSEADEIDPEEIQREADAKATAKANERIVKAEVRASAAGKLSDPVDALKFLDLSKFEVDADGNVDTEEIDDAIADLLEKKPYLAVPAQGERKRFKGSGDGGAKPNKPARPKSLGEAITRHYTK